MMACFLFFELVYPLSRVFGAWSVSGVCAGSITVVDELDYETVQTYNLTVRATDVMTGSYSEVIVRVQLEVSKKTVFYEVHVELLSVSIRVMVRQ